MAQWADQKRFLSAESSAEPGKWDTSRAAYQRGIMDAITDPALPVVVVVKPSQVGWTEILNNAVGYHIDQDPATMLLIQPSLELAEAWSKDRFAPMVRDTPTLADKVRDPRSRDTDNTIRQKVFPGGRLTIVGANSPAGLRARPIRIVLADEVDAYPVSAGTEGDPLALAAKRQRTFWNRKTLLGSTPLLKLTSVILREYARSDQRRYEVPCPACGEFQALYWRQVRWDKGEKGEHLPETAHYVCEACGAIWNDVERCDAVGRGRWVASRKSSGGVAGFHIIGMMSPWITLAEMATEFLDARKDPALLQVWTNTVLGEGWEEAAEKIEGSALVSRGENYGPQSVPDEVRIVTAGVDTQGDRLEVQIVGWGAHEESWAIAYEIIHGDPAQADVWEHLDELLVTPLHTEGGRELRIRAACVDSGGHYANEVLAFCRARHRRRIFAIKGAAGPRPIWPKRPSRGGAKGADILYVLGVDTAKDTLYGRLRSVTEPGPGYVHFPLGDGFDEPYFDQLTSEQVVTRKKEGRPYRVWILPSGKRNEALDTFVMALAARMSINIRLDRMVPVVRSAPPSIPDLPPVPPHPTAPPPPQAYWRPPPEGGWVGGRRGWFDRR